MSGLSLCLTSSVLTGESRSSFPIDLAVNPLYIADKPVDSIGLLVLVVLLILLHCSYVSDSFDKQIITC